MSTNTTIFASAGCWLEQSAINQLATVSGLADVIQSRGFKIGHAMRRCDRYPSFSDIPLDITSASDQLDPALGTISSGNHFVEFTTLGSAESMAKLSAKCEALLQQSILHFQAQHGLVDSSEGAAWYLTGHALALYWATTNRRQVAMNWFIQVTMDRIDLLSGPAEHQTSRATESPRQVLRPEEVRFEAARSSGKGGQHVNKTETAVRTAHLPTGLSAIARDERSQLSNKKTALRRLEEVLVQRQRNAQVEREERLWQQHDRLERGNAALTFTGPNFKPIKHQTGKHD